MNKYWIIAILDGALIALMVTFNSLLSQSLSMPLALIIIHFVGVIATLGLMAGSRTKIKSIRNTKTIYYIAGPLGVFNVMFNSIVFKHYGAVITLSLNVVGQLLVSILIDYAINKRNQSLNVNHMAGIGIMIVALIMMI